MDQADRLPPNNEQIEMAALGCFLIEPDTVAMARTQFRLTVEAWFMPACRIVVETVFGMADAGKPIDILLVQAALGKDTDRIGGSVFLDSCVDAATTPAYAGHYFDELRQVWIRRKVLDEARKLEVDARGDGKRGETLLQEAPSRFIGLVDEQVAVVSNNDLMTASITKWRDARANKKPAIGIHTPWAVLTEMMCGLENGITIIAGRPSAGKTTLEDNLAVHAAKQGVGVGRVTLDSTAQELLDRALCRSGEVSLPKLKFGFGREDQFAAIENAREELAQLPMWFADRIFDVRGIATWARMMKARHNIGLLTIDYIQQIAASELGREQNNTVARVTHVSRVLKQLALDLGIPVVVLSQLSRAVEQEGRTPQLSDLRDSGAIEQDAHKVIFVYRNVKKAREMEAENEGAGKKKRPVHIDLMKHKDGECGKLEFWLYPNYFRFVPAAPDFADDQLAGGEHYEESAPSYLSDPALVGTGVPSETEMFR